MKNKKEMQIKTSFLMILGLAVLIFLDQWTKHLALVHLAGKEPISLIDGVLELRYLENRGAAFGILQNQLWFFILLWAVFMVFAIWVFFRIPKTKKYIPLHIILLLMCAGGIGNVIDRIMRRFVVDFIYISLIDFPIFNVADIYVVVSCILLLIFVLFVYKEEDFYFFHKKGEQERQA